MARVRSLTFRALAQGEKSGPRAPAEGAGSGRRHWSINRPDERWLEAGLIWLCTAPRIERRELAFLLGGLNQKQRGRGGGPKKKRKKKKTKKEIKRKNCWSFCCWGSHWSRISCRRRDPGLRRSTDPCARSGVQGDPRRPIGPGLAAPACARHPALGSGAVLGLVVFAIAVLHGPAGSATDGPLRAACQHRRVVLNSG